MREQGSPSSRSAPRRESTPRPLLLSLDADSLAHIVSLLDLSSLQALQQLRQLRELCRIAMRRALRPTASFDVESAAWDNCGPWFALRHANRTASLGLGGLVGDEHSPPTMRTLYKHIRCAVSLPVPRGLRVPVTERRTANLGVMISSTARYAISFRVDQIDSAHGLHVGVVDPRRAARTPHMLSGGMMAGAWLQVFGPTYWGWTCSGVARSRLPIAPGDVLTLFYEPAGAHRGGARLAESKATWRAARVPTLHFAVNGQLLDKAFNLHDLGAAPNDEPSVCALVPALEATVASGLVVSLV